MLFMNEQTCQNTEDKEEVQRQPFFTLLIERISNFLKLFLQLHSLNFSDLVE